MNRKAISEIAIKGAATVSWSLSKYQISLSNAIEYSFKINSKQKCPVSMALLIRLNLVIEEND